MEDPRAQRFMRHMRRGDFEAAWRISDELLRERAGLRCDHWPRHFQWVWTGVPLEGKRVLIRCYHGLGDTIQFIRYASLLRAKTAEVTVWVQPTLIQLLETVRGIDRILPLHDGIPEWEGDADVEVMELPYIFRTTVETIPAPVPYIHVDRVPACGDRFAVGIAWRGGDWEPRRDVPFSLITQLAQVPGATLYALQKDAHPDERHERLERVIDSGSDMLTTARIMRRLNLVISVDSMPAHLAGALGVPTWTLLSADADWRWMVDRDDSPWYPTMRLFRQNDAGRWEPVITRVAAELARLAASAAKLRDQPQT
jgi:hypothetical protein